MFPLSKMMGEVVGWAVRAPSVCGSLGNLNKLPSKWCIVNGVLTYSLGNKDETNA